jgi:hypothetical protein
MHHLQSFPPPAAAPGLSINMTIVSDETTKYAERAKSIHDLIFFVQIHHFLMMIKSDETFAVVVVVVVPFYAMCRRAGAQ